MAKHILQPICILCLFLLPGKGACEKYFGYIINLSHDTVRCKIILGAANFDVPTKTIFFDQSFVKTELDGEIIKYGSDEIIGFAFFVFKEWHVYHGIPVSPREHRFLKKITEGKLSLYYRYNYNAFTRVWETNMYALKNATNESLYFKIGLLFQQEKIIQFFDDCPHLQSRIQNKTFHVGRFPEWMNIAAYYNDNC